MLAAYAARLCPDDPLAALEVGEVAAAAPPENHPDWVVVDVRAAGVNHHDLWSLRGVGLRAEQLPMILGTDAAGVAPDGREVIVHGVIGALPSRADGPGAEPRSLLSERYPGTFAEQLAVPAGNLVAKPASLSFEEAACLPTAWLTAYRMLFRSAGAGAGDTVLVQGAGGGVATAAVALGRAAGLEVYVTSRDPVRRDRAIALGAAGAIAPGERLPVPVDIVLETVGKATWTHSMRSVRPGGTIVVAGATSGDASPAGLQRLFFQEITVIGATMGSVDDLTGLLDLLVRTGVRPLIDGSLPLARAREALARLDSGAQFGKLVLTT